MSFRCGWLRGLWVVASRTVPDSTVHSGPAVREPSETSFVRTLRGETRRLTFRTSVGLGSSEGLYLQNPPGRPRSGPRPARCLQPPSDQPDDKNNSALSLKIRSLFSGLLFFWIKVVDRNASLSPSSGTTHNRKVPPPYGFLLIC